MRSKIAALGIAISLMPRGTVGCSTSSGVSDIQLRDTILTAPRQSSRLVLSNSTNPRFEINFQSPIVNPVTMLLDVFAPAKSLERVRRRLLLTIGIIRLRQSKKQHLTSAEMQRFLE